jgi:hypothetical protein
MMCVPLQTGPDKFVLVVVLFDESIKRMKEYDPGEILISRLGLPWARWHLQTIHLHYATAEEGNKLSSIKDMAELKAFLNHLARGWKFRPEAGDGDSMYQTPGKN